MRFNQESSYKNAISIKDIIFDIPIKLKFLLIYEKSYLNDRKPAAGLNFYKCSLITCMPLKIGNGEASGVKYFSIK